MRWPATPYFGEENKKIEKDLKYYDRNKLQHSEQVLQSNFYFVALLSISSVTIFN